MIEKSLTEADWKKFAKGRDFKDLPLLKAFAALEKAEKAGPDEQLAALDDIQKQADALAKAGKGDKELAAHLADIDQALKKQRKTTEAAAKAAEADAAQDEEPASALLDPKKLLQQLNLCKRDPERVMHFGFVDGKDKTPAVFAMHPRTNGRKLFATLQAQTGVKTGAYGTAWVDGTTLMLKLEKPLSGLVKKVRPAVKESGFRVTKVVLWNEDGSVFEQDGAEADGAQADGDGTATDAGDPLRQAYEARMAALQPRILEALQAQRGDATRLRAVAEFASEKAGAKNYDSALKALDSLEKLLAAGGAEATPAPGGGGAFSKVQFEKIHIDWNSRKQDIRQRLRALHAAIVEDWDDPVATTAAAKLEKVLARFNEGLGDTLDALRNSTTVAARNDLAGKAGEIADRYLAYLDSNPLVAHVEDNPFDIAVNARETLSGPLRELRGELAKLGAGATA